MRVKSVMEASAGTETIYFVGAHYEVVDNGTAQTILKYYYAGSQRIAMRTNGTLNFLLGDHLGSTSLTTDANGTVISEMRYKAWGEVRYASGTTPTQYQFTGQFSYANDFGLLFYNARWVDPQLGRFAQADSIVPGGVQGLDRYAYSLNNPIRYTDPSGHIPCQYYAGNGCTTTPMPTAAEQLQNDYGITLVGGWSKEDTYNIFSGVFKLAGALERASEKDGTTVFKDVFGPMTFTMGKDDSGKWHCEASGSGFGCTNAAGKIDEGIVVHELAHEFRNRYFSKMGKTIEVDLYSIIGKATIRDASDNYVSGVHIGSDGVIKWERTFDGYQSDRVPGVYHGKEWPKDGTVGWNQPGEEFADMFMNWALNSFSKDPAGAGAGRYTWMETNMTQWMSNYP